MIAFVKAVGGDGERHESSQFPVVSVFFGKTRSIVYEMCLLRIWLKPNQTALKGFHQIASLKTQTTLLGHPQVIRNSPGVSFECEGKARILLLFSILKAAISCVDSSLSQDWTVGEHLCWDFPIFSQIVVVFGVQWRRLIHPDDVPQD